MGVPEEIRRHINRVGPGRYRDPKTGRVYVDSHDMDDAMEETIDKANSYIDEQHAKRKKVAREGQMPPNDILGRRTTNLQRHVERMSKTVVRDTVSNMQARLRDLEKIKAYWLKEGMSVPEHVEPEIEEIRGLLAAMEGTDGRQEEEAPSEQEGAEDEGALSAEGEG